MHDKSLFLQKVSCTLINYFYLLILLLFSFQSSFALNHHKTKQLHQQHRSTHINKKKMTAKKTKSHSITIKNKQITMRKNHASLNKDHSIKHAALSAAPPTPTHLPHYLLNTFEQKLVNFVHRTVTTLRYSSYKLGGQHIDTNRGVYIVDCSAYVDHVLKSVYPDAYSYLSNWSGTERPTSDDFYHYFNHLPSGTRHYWESIDDVEQLRPGDILVFRYKSKFGNSRGGHVMIVMDQPHQEEDTFFVKVADSASAGHSSDTRLPRTSGIGIGTLLLKVDPKTYQPYAYAWKIGSHWETHVNFAMARPVSI